LLYYEYMNYNLKGTELSITPEIREYLEKRLSSLDKFLTNKEAARADVELEFLPGEERFYRAEVTLHDPGQKSARAEARGGALHEAIDLVMGELSGELSRGKKKRLHIFRHSAVRVKEFLRGWRKDV
jgi:putative sigma-54 modulation protein